MWTDWRMFALIIPIILSGVLAQELTGGPAPQLQQPSTEVVTTCVHPLSAPVTPISLRLNC
jgi:hypothetical protein